MLLKTTLVRFGGQPVQLNAKEACGTGMRRTLDTCERRFRAMESAEHRGNWDAKSGDDFTEGRTTPDMLKCDSDPIVQGVELLIEKA